MNWTKKNRKYVTSNNNRPTELCLHWMCKHNILSVWQTLGSSKFRSNLLYRFHFRPRCGHHYRNRFYSICRGWTFIIIDNTISLDHFDVVCIPLHKYKFCVTLIIRHNNVSQNTSQIALQYSLCPLLSFVRNLVETASFVMKSWVCSPSLTSINFCCFVFIFLSISFVPLSGNHFYSYIIIIESHNQYKFIDSCWNILCYIHWSPVTGPTKARLLKTNYQKKNDKNWGLPVKKKTTTVCKHCSLKKGNKQPVEIRSHLFRFVQVNIIKIEKKEGEKKERDDPTSDAIVIIFTYAWNIMWSYSHTMFKKPVSAWQ